MQFTDHYFEVRVDQGIRTLTPLRFWTFQEAVAEAEVVIQPPTTGGIWWHGEDGSEPVKLVAYTADGGMEVLEDTL